MTPESIGPHDIIEKALPFRQCWISILTGNRIKGPCRYCPVRKADVNRSLTKMTEWLEEKKIIIQEGEAT